MLIKRLTFIYESKHHSSREKGQGGKHPDERNIAKLEIDTVV
jgi:hypothetical protein